MSTHRCVYRIECVCNVYGHRIESVCNVYSVSIDIYTGSSHIHRIESVCNVYGHRIGEVGGWGRVPFSRNLMSPTPRRKWYLTTGRRFH